jgi:hypothetical protein
MRQQIAADGRQCAGRKHFQNLAGRQHRQVRHGQRVRNFAKAAADGFDMKPERPRHNAADCHRDQVGRPMRPEAAYRDDRYGRQGSQRDGRRIDRRCGVEQRDEFTDQRLMP